MCRPNTQVIGRIRFGGMVKRFMTIHKDEEQLEFHLARPMLAHPTNPDASYALRFLERCYSTDHDNHFWSVHFTSDQAKEGVFMAFFFLVRTAQVLNEAGNEAKARWVLDLARNRLPQAFDMKKPNLGPAQRAKRFIRRASERELASGFANKTGSLSTLKADDLPRRKVVKPEFARDEAHETAFKTRVHAYWRQ